MCPGTTGEPGPEGLPGLRYDRDASAVEVQGAIDEMLSGMTDPTVLDDLADAPVDTTQACDVPDEFVEAGRPSAMVDEELPEPDVQAILRDAGLSD